MKDCTNAELFKRYNDLGNQMDEIAAELKERNIDWQHLASHGLRVMATQVYRQKYKCELREAYEAVNAFIKELQVEAMMHLEYGYKK